MECFMYPHLYYKKRNNHEKINWLSNDHIHKRFFNET